MPADWQPVSTREPRVWVIDTNRVLDLWLFDHVALHPWRLALEAGALTWLSCPPMRAELAHVLGYTALQPWLQRLNPDAACARARVLAAFDRHAHLVAAPAHTPGWPRCTDRADQMFIDLALTHQAALLSKDRHVLKLRRRLRRWGVEVWSTPPGPGTPAVTCP